MGGGGGGGGGIRVVQRTKITEVLIATCSHISTDMILRTLSHDNLQDQGRV